MTNMAGHTHIQAIRKSRAQADVAVRFESFLWAGKLHACMNMPTPAQPSTGTEVALSVLQKVPLR